MRTGLSPDLIKKLLPYAKYLNEENRITKLEEDFPDRALPDGAMVTRFAPSPTGYMHIGGLYQALLDWKLARQSNGVFMLRIEDTDTKREVDDASKIIIYSLSKFGIDYDEGPGKGLEKSKYGNFFQSRRKDIYHSVVAHLLATGHAYPCFLSADEMEKIRENQKSSGLPTGIYGEFARDRDLTDDEIITRLNNGDMPSIRLHSDGDKNKKIFCKDAVRGSIAFPENDEDIVLIKSNDGLPTYHFAHLVDDHFMRTTHVVRGEEWLPSFPLHVQMFNMMEWKVPVYVHTSTIDTIDSETGKQRKLSKRKDPEANIETFLSQGWPVQAVLNYLLNIMASGYEEAKTKNPETDIGNYELKIKKIPTSGALFDWKKLEWWAKEFIGTMDEKRYEITDMLMEWAKQYADIKLELYSQRIGFDSDSPEFREYLHSILSIERDNPKRIRKDFITWKQTLEEISYFFDDLYYKGIEKGYVYSVPTDYEGMDEMHFYAKNYQEISAWFDFREYKGFKDKEVFTEFLKSFDINDDIKTWWGKIQDIAVRLGIEKPGDAAMALRVALTGRTNTPDLYSIMRVMREKMVIERIKKVNNAEKSKNRTDKNV